MKSPKRIPRLYGRVERGLAAAAFAPALADAAVRTGFGLLAAARDAATRDARTGAETPCPTAEAEGTDAAGSG